MSLFKNPNDIKALQKLLHPKKKVESDIDTEDEEEASPKKLEKKLSGAFKVATKSITKTNKPSPYDPLPVKQGPKFQNIEEWQTMQEAQDENILDQREIPKIDITYSQSISTEDVFLQLSNRTGATASCETMLLEILLPGDTTSIDKMVLNVCETEIELSTAMYRLKMPLPHPINVERSSACYKRATEKLVLKCHLVRELDFVNF